MRLILQRVTSAKVTINNKINGKIKNGLMILVGFTINDNEETIDKMIEKTINLRIFDDKEGSMNLSLIDTKGSILSISQFTLYANLKKGRRPSFIDALDYNKAEKLYKIFNQKIKEQNIIVEEGIFGSEMSVQIANEGPVTIILDSKEV